jgi:hypothetical protein
MPKFIIHPYNLINRGAGFSEQEYFQLFTGLQEASPENVLLEELVQEERQCQ